MIIAKVPCLSSQVPIKIEYHLIVVIEVRRRKESSR
jgi:hypothetical protein